jgi:hypothetical protein
MILISGQTHLQPQESETSHLYFEAAQYDYLYLKQDVQTAHQTATHPQMTARFAHAKAPKNSTRKIRTKQ